MCVLLGAWLTTLCLTEPRNDRLLTPSTYPRRLPSGAQEMKTLFHDMDRTATAAVAGRDGKRPATSSGVAERNRCRWDRIQM